jgi:hypothetical protein
MELTIETLVTSLGGVGEAAKKLGRSHSTICDWKRSGLLPAPALADVHRATGIDPAKLLKLTEKKLSPQMPDGVSVQADAA